MPGLCSFLAEDCSSDAGIHALRRDVELPRSSLVTACYTDDGDISHRGVGSQGGSFCVDAHVSEQLQVASALIAFHDVRFGIVPRHRCVR